MSDDLDLRVIEREHVADARFREDLRRELVAILDGDEAPPIDDRDAAATTIDIAGAEPARLPARRRRWAVGAAVLAGAAVAAGLVVVTSDPAVMPSDDSVRATEPSVDATAPVTDAAVPDSVPATDPGALDSVPLVDAAPVATPELFTQIAPGSSVPLPDAPIAGRRDGAAVWTGSEMIVWGGTAYVSSSDTVELFADGAAFDLATGTWRVIAQSPLSARSYPAAVWTGTEVVLWGGFVGEDVRTYDGAAYNPTTDTWRTLPEVPFAIPDGIMLVNMVWTGDEAVVTTEAVTAAYDPDTDSWRRLDHVVGFARPIWTGEAVVWVGDDLTRWVVATDTWTVLPASYSEVIGVPSPDGVIRTFIALPEEIGAPVEILDEDLRPLGSLPPFPGDPGEFGETIGASGNWVGGIAIFVIWGGVFPYEPTQTWSLDPETQDWRQLDGSVPEGLLVVGDVVLDWGVGADGLAAAHGVAYRAGGDAP